VGIDNPRPRLRIPPKAETAAPATATLTLRATFSSPWKWWMDPLEATSVRPRHRPSRGKASRRAAPPARPRPRTSVRGSRAQPWEATPART
jgi:hypothetical protein